MQTTVERTAEHTVKLTIEVPSDQFDKDLDKTYRAIAREVKIPGFRPGKAPKPIIDAQVGHDVVLEEFVNASVPTYFRTAVSDEDLAPIGEPEVDVEQLEPGKPFIFTATVEVRPRIELSQDDYKAVKVTRPPLLRCSVKACVTVPPKVTMALKVTVRLVTIERWAAPPLIWVLVTRGVARVMTTSLLPVPPM